MQPDTGATYEIQLAAARVEAVMAKTAKAMEVLLDGPDSLNSHVAKAVKTILDDHMRPLENRLRELDDALNFHHPDPATRPEPPGSHAMFADRVSDLTSRYENHMRRHHRRMDKYTAQGVFYTFTITAVVINAAVRTLGAEVISRDTSDPTARAYRTALLETAEEIPGRGQVISNLVRDGEAKNDRMKRHLQMAQEAEADTVRLVTLHSAASS